MVFSLMAFQPLNEEPEGMYGQALKSFHPKY